MPRSGVPPQRRPGPVGMVGASRGSGQASATSAGLHDAKLAVCLAECQDIVERLAGASALAQAALASSHPHAHVRRTFERSAPGTLVRHIAAWRHWERWCSATGVPPTSPELSQLLDFLHEMLHGARADRRVHRERSDVRSVVSGLRFFADRLGAPDLQGLLGNPSVHAYSVDSRPARDRREAPPLPLLAVVAMERRVTSDECSMPESLLYGGLLCCVWASLRFGDVQRCRPDSVTLDGGVIRGLCWRTKTSRSGQPWGCLASGASGSPSCGWGPRWVASLRAFMSGGPPDDLDFLIPDVVMDHRGSLSVCLRRPMSYASAMCAVRNMLRSSMLDQFAASAFAASTYTLHCAKTTLLSWSKQLAVAEDLRREQGHHRVGAGGTSVRLYSRDDVWGPLRLQFQIVSALRSGWRPLTPQARGARPPLPEPPVSLDGEAVCPPALLSPPVLPLASASQQPIDEPAENSSGSSVDSDASSAHGRSEADSESAAGAGVLPGDMVLANLISGVYHAAIPTDENTPQHRRAHAGAGWWRAACGASLSQDPGAVAVGPAAPFSALPCCRAACKRRLTGAPVSVPAAGA